MDRAVATGEAGDLRQAIRILTDLLPDQIDALGVDHPLVLTTRNLIATWTDGVGDAVVFSQRAPSVASTYEILGNAVLRRVVTTALGLPQQIVNQSVEAQRRAIEARLDVGRLDDPRQVQRLAERYLAAKGMAAAAAGAAAAPWAAAAAARGITLLL